MLPLFITIQAFFTDTFERIERNEKGATAVEYGLLVGLLSIAIVGTLLLLGPRLDGLFQQVLAVLP
ncbi:Flp family type IVb pilin [Kocuria rosea]|uniref:Flp family type IVb pilin n=1 Tax=Kocuria rosea TaxID=1275 RepID=A0A4R5YN19_KOCRO|nr:Flp family type IVb pilin [Kocuria rosea]TDL46984.1 Flp family type IVb pilin [Kocuria rosea]